MPPVGAADGKAPEQVIGCAGARGRGPGENGNRVRVTATPARGSLPSIDRNPRRGADLAGRHDDDLAATVTGLHLPLGVDDLERAARVAQRHAMGFQHRGEPRVGSSNGAPVDRGRFGFPRRRRAR